MSLAHEDLVFEPFLKLAKFRREASKFLHVLLIVQFVSGLAVLLFCHRFVTPFGRLRRLLTRKPMQIATGGPPPMS